jgi:6,7-dimethyl-8-ribityllumazine synthase
MNEYKGSLDGSGKRFAIVASRFNESFVTHIVDGAVDCLQRLGAEEDDVDLFWVPGSFEVPQGTRAAAMTGNYDAVIALGVLIRGSTPHFDLIAAEVTRAIGAVGRDTGVPTIFGIVTADTMEQAAERCGAKMGNRGWTAAEAAVEMANLGEAFSGWRGPGEAMAVVHEHDHAHEHEPAAPAPAKRPAKAARKGGKGDRNRRRAGA